MRQREVVKDGVTIMLECMQISPPTLQQKPRTLHICHLLSYVVGNVPSHRFLCRTELAAVRLVERIEQKRTLFNLGCLSPQTLCQENLGLTWI